MVDERKPSPVSLGQATGFLRVTLLRGPRRLKSSLLLFGFSPALPGSFSQSTLLVSNPLTRKTGTHTKWLLQKRLSWGVGGEGVKDGVCCPGFLKGGSSERPGTRTSSTDWTLTRLEMCVCTFGALPRLGDGRSSSVPNFSSDFSTPSQIRRISSKVCNNQLEAIQI